MHCHYWLSGQVGWLASERWGVPLVHSMHTMAKVKNANLADGDTPDPRTREIGEEQVVAAADRLVANTEEEAGQLQELYDADPARIAVVSPGVDLDRFRPGDRQAARARLGLPADAFVLLFVGRIQPLKAPDVLIRAAALLAEDPALRRRLVVAVVGGPSGTGLAHPTHLADLAARPRDRRPRPVRAAGLTGPSWPTGTARRRSPPCRRTASRSAWWPSSRRPAAPRWSAASVGGLRTAVADGVSGVLVDGHDPRDWADVLAGLAAEPAGSRPWGAAPSSTQAPSAGR